MLVYAETVSGDRSTMRQWSTLDEDWHERGACGDELEYNPVWDRFTYWVGTGCSAVPHAVPNPVPGDPLAGARLVADMADAEWAK